VENNGDLYGNDDMVVGLAAVCVYFIFLVLKFISAPIRWAYKQIN
jgi:hypothetical protein